MAFLIIFFVIMPILEIAILIKVGNYIGTMNTVLVIILTGILGAVLTRIQGFMIVQKINERLNRGMMPSQEILDGALVFVGGFCLLMPGLIGDLIGIILLIPWTRLLVRMLAAFIIKTKLDRGQAITIIPLRSYDDPEI